jgi:hypothetical protein
MVAGGGRRSGRRRPVRPRGPGCPPRICGPFPGRPQPQGVRLRKGQFARKASKSRGLAGYIQVKKPVRRTCKPSLFHYYPPPLAGRFRPVTRCGRSSGVEHNLAKVGVEGSNPFARSILTKPKSYRPAGGRDRLPGATSPCRSHGGSLRLPRAATHTPSDCQGPSTRAVGLVDASQLTLPDR